RGQRCDVSQPAARSRDSACTRAARGIVESMTAPRRLIVAITGATGTVFGVRLLEMLQDTDIETHLIMSRWAARTLVLETSCTVEQVEALATRVYPLTDQGAAVSSGSFLTLGMVGVPGS